jgi:hypothetical protein
MTAPASTLSRRALFGIGGGTLLLAGVAAWRQRPSRAEAAARAERPSPYADHQGWMVTLAEKQALQVLPPAGGTP